MIPSIDFHVHAYPESVFRDSQAWALKRHEAHWASLVGPGSIQGWADAKTMLRDMDAADVEICVLQGWYWENQETCDEQNAWCLEWMREAPDRFRVFATVQPKAGARAFDQLKAAIDQGCCGVGELLPQVQGFSLEDPEWLRMAAWLESAGIPVCMHVTEPLGHDYAGRIETPLDSYLSLAKAFPELTLILAHWGGGIPFYLQNTSVAAHMKNVYFDTAASPLLYGPEIWRNGVALAGVEKILFGSDYPLRIYPRQQKKPELKRLKEEALTSGLDEDDIRHIFYENGSRLLSRISKPN